jgi:hypothetical protein
MSFEELTGVIAMLIENINMQMEAEVTDLIDRRHISLYGAITGKANMKTDVTLTSQETKLHLGGHKKSVFQTTPFIHGATSPDHLHR